MTLMTKPRSRRGFDFTKTFYKRQGLQETGLQAQATITFNDTAGKIVIG